MIRKHIMIATSIVAISAVAIISSTTATHIDSFYAASALYSCASIHFGMKDEDRTAMTYDCSTQSANMSGYNVAHNIDIESIECTYCYTGGTYTNENESYSQYAIRIGKSKTVGSMTISFAKQIVGCTIYALQYASDPVTVCVNDQETTLLHNASSASKANAVALAYDAYSFEFESTSSLVIKSKQASKTVNGKSVSASRFYLADIALKVA